MKYSITPLSGLGNIVIELIGFYHLLKKSGINPYTQVEIPDWRDNIRETNMYYGGHPRQKFRHLGLVFPKINYQFVQKSLKDPDVNLTLHFAQNDYHGDELLIVSQLTSDPKTKYTVVLGWFFHPFYRLSFREEIIRWLEFGPEVREDVHKFFWDNSISPSRTVSFHNRLGSPGDGFDTVNIKSSDHAKALQYLKYLYPELDTVLVCSESREKFEAYFPAENFPELGYRYIFYDSDAENCLYAMKECAHHLISNSTLSYSVLYLDEKFPQKSLAIGTHFEYISPHFLNPEFISKDRKTGLLHVNKL